MNFSDNGAKRSGARQTVNNKRKALAPLEIAKTEADAKLEEAEKAQIAFMPIKELEETSLMKLAKAGPMGLEPGDWAEFEMPRRSFLETPASPDTSSGLVDVMIRVAGVICVAGLFVLGYFLLVGRNKDAQSMDGPKSTDNDVDSQNVRRYLRLLSLDLTFDRTVESTF